MNGGKAHVGMNALDVANLLCSPRVCMAQALYLRKANIFHVIYGFFKVWLQCALHSV